MMDDAQTELLAALTRIADLAGLLADATAHTDTVPADLANVRLAKALEAESDAALRISVGRARTAGHTWQELGDLLGVSRQAAFQRFGRPIDPRTGEDMSNALLPGAADKATALLADWFDGNIDKARSEFDATMTAQLPPEKMSAVRAQVIGLCGAYEGMDKPVAHQVGDYTVVDVPLHFEAAEMKGRVAYDADGKVAGLFVLRPDAT